MSIEAQVEVLHGSELQEREPELVGVEEALVIHDQARLNPVRFSLALAAHAGCVATGIDVTGLGSTGDQATLISTSHGDIHPGAVVFATGIAPTRYVTVRHDFMKGHLIATAPVDFRLRSQIATPFGGAFQLEDGRLVSGGTLDAGDESAMVREEIVEAIRRGVEAVLPRAAGVPITHAWCGFRPHTPDRLPIIDKIPGLANAWFTSGHYRTGILMAAATGAALAEWIASGSQPANITAFSLARLDTPIA
jgi:glycine/D-amino acid oxidase-like deaminating enzyme